MNSIVMSEAVALRKALAVAPSNALRSVVGQEAPATQRSVAKKDVVLASALESALLEETAHSVEHPLTVCALVLALVLPFVLAMDLWMSWAEAWLVFTCMAAIAFDVRQTAQWQTLRALAWEVVDPEGLLKSNTSEHAPVVALLVLICFVPVFLALEGGHTALLLCLVGIALISVVRGIDHGLTRAASWDSVHRRIVRDAKAGPSGAANSQAVVRNSSVRPAGVDSYRSQS